MCENDGRNFTYCRHIIISACIKVKKRGGCAKCGNRTNSNDKFCSNCGASIWPRPNKLLVTANILMLIACI
ncbi:zinc-ribbon domain-containing protein [Anoxybacteroides rupiense]|uniref:zinc-ribbon domain-containing protein n=1 Tax=Anoxybacteroides rupiense TaxID=311460 RepID=UPI00367216E9